HGAATHGLAPIERELQHRDAVVQAGAACPSFLARAGPRGGGSSLRLRVWNGFAVAFDQLSIDRRAVLERRHLVDDHAAGAEAAERVRVQFGSAFLVRESILFALRS